jgi:hypothetical protein
LQTQKNLKRQKKIAASLTCRKVPESSVIGANGLRRYRERSLRNEHATDESIAMDEPELINVPDIDDQFRGLEASRVHCTSFPAAHLFFPPLGRPAVAFTPGETMDATVLLLNSISAGMRCLLGGRAGSFPQLLSSSIPLATLSSLADVRLRAR